MFPAYKNVLTNTKVYDNISFARPVSQVVKTPPSHGGDRGSTPLRVTRVMARSRYALRALFFIFTESAFVHSGIFLFPIYRPWPDAICVRTFFFFNKQRSSRQCRHPFRSPKTAESLDALFAFGAFFFLIERIFSCLSRTSFASAVFSPHAVQPPCRAAQRRYAGMCALFFVTIIFLPCFCLSNCFLQQIKNFICRRYALTVNEYFR